MNGVLDVRSLVQLRKIREIRLCLEPVHQREGNHSGQEAHQVIHFVDTRRVEAPVRLRVRVRSVLREHFETEKRSENNKELKKCDRNDQGLVQPSRKKCVYV